MSPPVEFFSPSEISQRAQYQANGKRRKPDIDLYTCKLLELSQYDCQIENPKVRDSRVVCKEVVRLFRQCRDGLVVETTAWEGMGYKAS